MSLIFLFVPLSHILDRKIEVGKSQVCSNLSLGVLKLCHLSLSFSLFVPANFILGILEVVWIRGYQSADLVNINGLLANNLAAWISLRSNLIAYIASYEVLSLANLRN